MALDFQLVIDCADPHTLADWWADTLGWEAEGTDEDFIRRMIKEGFASDDDTVVHKGKLHWKTGAAINHPDGRESGRPRILFQLVPEPKTIKNRLHIDVSVGGGRSIPLAVRTERVEAEAARLVALGATRLRSSDPGIDHYAVAMRDPEGNEFDIN